MGALNLHIAHFATPRIADPPRRTIILLDSDFAGSDIGAFGGIY
jgi:5S rRNA maturation endonuclease (ribonuclease M5)